ncbi:uncharacterized protein BX664DRAFT_322115 [Halteromyces radiatus]|uniref:uncharacterized protein n=1 Tax=Halteromyces radiatus TaxID=101107 RepID=UPI002220DC1A|nr:uncharacterized protein BX664DRAFT_322115 [Halteromyces radiatus]KAI8099786.1 hypothetical protein BX664DRAFT_322115 [Halteromyces radiatus]
MTETHNNLPTLQQVLTRKTLPPICLYNYYIVMRDRLHMEEVLDFYLDVQHHEQLWRRYVRSMHKTGMLSEDDLVEGFHSPRVLSRISHLSNETPKQQEENESMRPETIESKLPNRQDVSDSAQHILLRYLVPSASKELTQLPLGLKNATRAMLEQEKRDDPAVFAEAKDYLFELMQRQAYPKFLRIKVWGNVTLWQQLGRLILGLVSLLAGFATGFSLIFLGYSPWGVRWWILLPFWIGILNVLVFLTGLDPLWVLFFNASETTTFHFNKIKQPQVKRILWSRSIWLLITSLIVSAVLTVIFCAVPSKRL